MDATIAVLTKDEGLAAAVAAACAREECVALFGTEVDIRGSHKQADYVVVLHDARGVDMTPSSSALEIDGVARVFIGPDSNKGFGLWVRWPTSSAYLAHAVAVARIRTVLTTWASQIVETDHLPPTLKTAMATASAAPRPFRSVQGLCASIGRNRTTLWHHWTKFLGAQQIRLQDYLDWILILRALELKSPDVSWNAVAAQLRISPFTLRRALLRLLSRRAGEVTANDHFRAIRLIGTNYINPLLIPHGGIKGAFCSRIWK
jgi:hypothetical protein